MNKTRFRLLVFFMSLSLIGIILVQLYWINSSLKGNSEQFKSNVQQALGKTAGKVQEKEKQDFFLIYGKIADSTGRTPVETDFDKYALRNGKFIPQKSAAGVDNTDTFIGDEDNKVDATPTEKAKLKDEKRMSALLLYKKVTDKHPIESRVSVGVLGRMLKEELSRFGVDTPFEFAVVSGNGSDDNGVTHVKSPAFKYIKEFSQDHAIFDELEVPSRYRLFISFPKKEAYLFSELLGITSLSIVFTLIIIIAYLSAINQLIKQKQISEIKTDFINNMTHEFKTPIATINLALDAIKNPKVFEDKEKVDRYLQMIRDENKRMHAQVENVLQISKLDKKELDIEKGQADIHEIIESAIEHVHLIIEARQGSLTRHFHAQRTTALLNEVHFTNVIVNILDNAIKYSPDEPLIDIYTENVKDFIMIKIRDRGLGMSKTTLKRIFEKFYREHTGDIHNVKGHGLGLAYVKRIIDDHNCHIYVESEKGKGSTFIIKMPLIN